MPVVLSAALACGPRGVADWQPGPDPAAFLAALDREGEVATYVQGALYLEFGGGFLGDDTITLNGQLLLARPDQVRLVGAYGAFAKVFDLGVAQGRFRLVDHRGGATYEGDAADPAAAADLGLAVRPADIPRLVAIGGRSVLDGAEDIAMIGVSGDSTAVSFRLPGDAGGRWRAVYRGVQLRTLERWMVTPDGDRPVLRAVYSRYGRDLDSEVPGRIDIARLDGDERARIEPRSLERVDAIDAGRFEVRVPPDSEVIALPFR